MPTSHEQFLALHADTSAEARALIAQVGAGEIGPRQFGDLFAAILQEAHTEAVVIGRQHAGDTAPLEDDDRRFAQAIVDGESEFLAGFVRDLEDDRYLDAEGNFRLGSAQQRAGLYVRRLAGSANEAMVLTLPPETTLLYWILGQNDDSHCQDCPALASRSPYRPDDVPTHPGAGETACLSACQCNWHTSSGLVGFRAPQGA